MAANPKLRAYQRTAIESARRALTKSGSCILQMPTGAGKTRAATEIVATSRGVIWFVCHRQEIERQVAKAFTAAGIDFGIVSPRGELQPDKRVQIASVGTLPRRIKKLPTPKMVIWDECHHVAAKSWASIRAKLKDARHLGLTATPERLDGRGLGEWFAELVTGPGISELIKRGYLSEFRYFAPSDPDLTNAKLQAGDYKKSDLGRVMNTPVLIGDAVREYKKNANGKRALAFCASVEASQALAVRFNKDGIKAAHVDGTTPSAERDSAIEDLAAGRIKVLCNVEVFTEGFDLPAIDAVILMRPTKSPTLLLQMIGRGLRKAPGKDVAIIMDHAGLHRDHAWFADDWHWSLDGGAAKARRAAGLRGPRRCPECKEVRAERVEVCSCGYEFPTGREVGEFDGVLTEVRGVVPDGCVTIAEFARRHKVAWECVKTWVPKGLHVMGNFVVSSDGDDWVSKNIKPRRLGGSESILKFADMHGVSESAVYRWIKLGMPVGVGGVVDPILANPWVLENSRKVQNIKRMSKSAFARRHGKVDGAANYWIKIGMPFNKDGTINALVADKWVAKNIRVAPPSGYETISDFARRVNRRANVVQNWSAIYGMPVNRDGYVEILGALRWCEGWLKNLPQRHLRTPHKIPDSAWPKKKAARAKRKSVAEEQRPSL